MVVEPYSERQQPLRNQRPVVVAYLEGRQHHSLRAVVVVYLERQRLRSLRVEAYLEHQHHHSQRAVAYLDHSLRQAFAYLGHQQHIRSLRQLVVAYLDQQTQSTDSKVALDQRLVGQDFHLVQLMVLILASIDNMQCLTLKQNSLDFYQQNNSL